MASSSRKVTGTCRRGLQWTLYRSSSAAPTGKPPLYPDDATVLAVVSDAITRADGRPVFALDAIDEIAAFAASRVPA